MLFNIIIIHFCRSVMSEVERWSAEKVGVWLKKSDYSSLRQRFIGKHILSHD